MIHPTLRRTLLVGALFAPLALNACGTGHSRSGQEEGTPLAVKTVALERTTEPARLEVSGEYVARNRVEISSRTAGRIAELPVAEGSRVAQGDLLARLDAPELTAAVTQSRAAEEAAATARDVAVRQAERFKRLAAEAVVTPRDYELVDMARAEAEAAYAAARATREMAEKNLEYGVLRAPRAGVVVARMARPGDLAVPGRPILVMEDPGDAEIRVTVPAQLNWPLRRGTRALVTGSLPGVAPVDAEVTRVSPGAEAHTVVAFLRVPNLDQPTGTYVKVALLDDTPSDVLRVPEAALLRRGPLTGVFLVHEGRAVLRWIRLDDAGRVQSGLTGGETLVLAPSAELTDGAPVEVQ